MKLSEFVENSISEIFEGVKSVNEKYSNGAYKAITNRFDERIINIDFDVSVTSESENTGKANGGITILEVFKLGTSIQDVKSLSNANRIKFSIPVKLPS